MTSKVDAAVDSGSTAAAIAAAGPATAAAVVPAGHCAAELAGVDVLLLLEDFTEDGLFHRLKKPEL